MKKAYKLLSAFIIIAILLSVTVYQAADKGVNAQALDAADLCLEQTIDLVYSEEIEIISLNYKRQELYNYYLEFFGYAYDIDINGLKGFALMINRGHFYEVTEIYLDKLMPFSDIIGLAVYLTPLTYIAYLEEIYYDIESGEVLEEGVLSILSERGFGFEGGTPGQTITETVSYTLRTEEAYRIPGTFPNYANGNVSAYPNACAATAGSIVMGYWGRYYPELMPNFTVGRAIGTSYSYNPYNAAVQEVINDLYVKMETNIDGSGATATGCRNGMIKYANSKNRNLTLTNVVSNNQLNYTAYINHLNALTPVILFLNTYNLIGESSIVTSVNTSSITKTYYSGMHIVISFGYLFVNYYNGSSNFRTDYFIRVATGIDNMKLGYIKLYDGAVIQEGCAAYIY